MSSILFKLDNSFETKSSILFDFAIKLWKISFPLMISLMSGSLMLFFNRIFLAHFSIDSLNASASAGTVASTFHYLFISVIVVAEVFVGKFNGANRLDRIGPQIWQGIWFALATFFFYLPLGYYGSSLLFEDPLSLEYFKWLMYFGPVFCLVPALVAFYIGQGKVAAVIAATFFCNSINILLDLVLIFGVPSLIPPLGIQGAAIATGISESILVIILFTGFFSKNNHKKFHTRTSKIEFPLLWNFLKLGFPLAIAHTVELFSWSCYFTMMHNFGRDYMTVASVGQSLLFLFSFISEGMSKGITAFASNLIGSKQRSRLSDLFTAAMGIYMFLFLLLGFLFLINPSKAIDLFIPNQSPLVKEMVLSSSVFVWIFFFFEGISWLLAGLLTALGDTKFLFRISAFAPWIFALLPIYFLVKSFHAGPQITWAVTSFYSFVVCSIYYMRFCRINNS